MRAMLDTETAAGVDPELALRTLPPRPPYRALARPHLTLDVPPFAGTQVVLLEAAAGWGKSALLAQWRRAALDAGHLVAWLTAAPDDEPRRLVLGLALALDRACGAAKSGRADVPDAIGAATGWLARAAALPHDLLLLIDDAERLPAEGRRLLRYVLHNLPPNVRVGLAGRTGLRVFAAELDPATWWLAGAAQLRLTVEETCTLAAAAGMGADDGVRLHESVEGWPLGVQLALRSRARTQGPPDPRHIVADMLDALAPDDLAFLLAVSICDLLHPDLCAALAGTAAPARLARLAAATPLFTASESDGWVRLNTPARDALRQRVAAWPAAQRAPLHLRASAWYERHGLLPDAARHAHAAGASQRAFDLAERGLMELVPQGRVDALAIWQDLLPADELRLRPRLRLAVAWSLALSDRPALALPHVEALLANAGDDQALRHEAAMIVCAAHVYADAPDRFAAAFGPWAGRQPADADPWLRQAHANRSALLALLQGRPAQARRCLNAPGAAADGGYGARWAALLYGYSYLWQGQVQLAADVLHAPVASADAALGRRHPLAAMLAAVLATALFERGQLETAQLLLANRLDVLERSATPDILLMGHVTAARIAAAYGMEHRALDFCDALLAAGEHRKLPRACMAALGEQIRIHAVRERPDTCRRLYDRLLGWLDAAPPHGPLWQRQAVLERDLARARRPVLRRLDRRADGPRAGVRVRGSAAAGPRGDRHPAPACFKVAPGPVAPGRAGRRPAAGCRPARGSRPRSARGPVPAP
jgi:LuxR family maltose regulon positive regulatory protein